MSHAYETAAVRIVDWLHHAERDLIGSTVVTFSGETGTCKGVQLDDHHGLCFTLDDPIDEFVASELGRSRKWFPVSTIRLKS